MCFDVGGAAVSGLPSGTHNEISGSVVPAGTADVHVFISYAHIDRERVLVLARRLRDESLGVFLDEWEIVPGDNVTAEIERAISRSDAGIVVFSTASVTRAWVLEEYYALLSRAVSGRGRLIPVVLDDVELPAFAGSRLAVDLRDPEGPVWETAFAALVRGVRKRSN